MPKRTCLEWRAQACPDAGCAQEVYPALCLGPGGQLAGARYLLHPKHAPTRNRKPRGAASPKHAATYWADMPAYPAQIAEGLGGLGLGFSGLGFKARVYVLGGKYQNIQTDSPTLLKPKH